ncbi:MAG: hypothetical protein HGA39_06985 [Coriobacteriia bacterium]|nr:hypothetical protein [Coriobacteriia bacterium]
MTDTNFTDVQQTARPAGFFSTSTGKVVLVAIVAVVLLAAVGVAAYMFLIGTLAPSSSTGGSPQVTVTSTVTSGTAGSASAPAEPPLSETFILRNVFAPTVKPSIVAAPTGGGSSVTVPTNTLYLVSTQLTPTKTATFIWNNVTYVVAEGGQVGTSPWKVLTISEGSVLMLYGDSQVTLTSGQSVGK